jgi:hypothetical protein
MLSYRRLIFFCIFLFAYLAGGAINHFAPDLKIVYLSLFCIPFLFPFQRSNLPLFFLVSILAIEFSISSALNNKELSALAQYLRLLFIPVAIKILTDKSVTDITSDRFKSGLIIIGVIQLPVVLIQQTFYESLSQYSVVPIAEADYDFGTFGLQNDFAMSFYLVGLVFLLLNTTSFSYKPSTRVLLSCWLTLTVLVSNSSVSYFIVSFIWLMYFRNIFKARRTVLFSATAASIALVGFINSDIFLSRLPYVLTQIDLSNASEQMALFSAGELSKVGGVAYFLNEPFKLFGDGPLNYYDPVSRQYVLGVTGHLLSFYGEVGFLGLLLSYLICILILPGPIRSMPTIIIWVISLFILSLSVNILADVSVMLTFCIVSQLFFLAPEHSERG